MALPDNLRQVGVINQYLLHQRCRGIEGDLIVIGPSGANDADGSGTVSSVLDNNINLTPLSSLNMLNLVGHNDILLATLVTASKCKIQGILSLYSLEITVTSLVDSIVKRALAQSNTHCRVVGIELLKDIGRVGYGNLDIRQLTYDVVNGCCLLTGDNNLLLSSVDRLLELCARGHLARRE